MNKEFNSQVILCTTNLYVEVSYQGYLYTVNGTNQRSGTCECSERNFNCSGSLQSNVAIETVLHQKVHCYVPSTEKIEATKLRETFAAIPGRQRLMQQLQPLLK